MENKIKDAIIKALKDIGCEVDNGIIIVNDQDTNNGVSIKVETLS